MSAIVAFLGVRGTVAAALALLLALAAGVQTARLWDLQADTADDAATLKACQGANAGFTAAIAEQQRLRDEAEAARERQAEQAAAAIAQAEEKAEQAQDALDDFKRRWGNRAPSCAIALTQMEAACAGSLSDY